MPELNEINDSLAEFEEELSRLKTAAELIEDAKNTAQSTIIESNNLKDSAKRLQEDVVILMRKIDGIDFPTRLDKIDKSIIEINTAIQNMANRFDIIEKMLKVDFNSKLLSINNKLEKYQGFNNIFFVLLFLLTAGSLITLLVKFIF